MHLVIFLSCTKPSILNCHCICTWRWLLHKVWVQTLCSLSVNCVTEFHYDYLLVWLGELGPSRAEIWGSKFFTANPSIKNPLSDSHIFYQMSWSVIINKICKISAKLIHWKLVKFAVENCFKKSCSQRIGKIWNFAIFKWNYLENATNDFLLFLHLLAVLSVAAPGCRVSPGKGRQENCMYGHGAPCTRT